MSEDSSTHSMVEGLHRRMDNWDGWRGDVVKRLDANDLRHADADKRMALLEQEVVHSRQAGDRMYEHFVDAFTRVETAQAQTAAALVTHDEREQKYRASTLAWLRGTFVAVVLALFGMIVTLLSRGAL